MAKNQENTRLKNIVKKGNGGITLIALVVTIIVLLLLAGISISMLAGNNGILKRAGEAKEKTTNTQQEEQVRLTAIAALTEGKGTIKDDVLKTELKNSISGVTDSDITGNENKGWQVKIGNKAYYIEPNGETGEAFWEEVKDENGDITEIRKVDGTVTGLKIGDTIGYNAQDGATTTEIQSSQSVNGYENQTIRLSDYTGTWRLLGVEKGNLNIISSTIVGVPKGEGDSESNGVYTNSYFKLKGRTGYQNAESELNRICSLYGTGKYALSARSIKVEDINKITGYDPEHIGVNTNKATAEQIAAGTVYGKDLLHQYGNKVTYYWDGTDKPKYTSNITGWESGNLSQTHNWSKFKGFSWWDGTSFQKSDYTEAPGKICTLTSDYYYYYPETLTNKNTDPVVGLENDSVLREMLFNSETDYYWLASRCILTDSICAYFDVRLVRSGFVARYGLAISNGFESGVGVGVRPIVTLNPDIKLEPDGENAWKFVE